MIHFRTMPRPFPPPAAPRLNDLFLGLPHLLTPRQREIEHTSNLGFQLDSIATLGRKVRERQGAWVRSLVLLNIVSLVLQFTNAWQLTAAKERFKGGKHATTMNQTERMGQLVQKFFPQVHRLASQSASRNVHSCLRWQQNCGFPAAPCWKTVENP